jgi:hypothetical protein
MMKLDNRLYRKEALMQAIEDWKDVCEISIVDDSFQVSFEKGTEEKVRDEFSNYVLGLMKNMGLV